MTGSAKHLLDLLDRPDYVPVMNELLAGAEAHIDQHDTHHPAGWDDPTEWALHKFCRQYLPDWTHHDQLAGWWPGRRLPRWDLLSICTVGGRRGILLVEAKAHEGECDYDGKELDPWAPVGSKRNHQRIIQCLGEAQDGLNAICDGVFRLGVESHYQLANRLAYLWKLAGLGVPTVLLYLGFTGDTYFQRDYLQDADHWQRVMGAYMHGVVPLGFPDKSVSVSGDGSATMLIASRPVAAVSLPDIKDG